MDTGSGLGRAQRATELEQAHDDLRATADAAARTADRLAEIERRKLALDPRDPELTRLSEEAAELSRTLSLATRVETQISDELAEGAG